MDKFVLSNGSNMKGKHQGVQKRLLAINPRVFTHHVVVMVLTLYYVIWPILVQKLYHFLELYDAYIHCFLLLQKDGKFYKIMCQV